MVLVYGECRRNVNNALQVYAERYPDRRTPSRRSFYRVVTHFVQDGSVQPRQRRRQRSATSEENDTAVLAAVAFNPHVSSRNIARESGISQTSVMRILHRQKFHPYHVSLHQELHGNDFARRVQFCEWAHQQIRGQQIALRQILFSDEAHFTNHGEVNRHNMHYWATENPRWLRQVEHQRPWSVNVWCGIMGDHIIGPYFIDGTLNGQKYADFLTNELPLLLEDVSLQDRLNMWFQHDGCPAHNANIARRLLDREYPGRWIGRGGPVQWPARSPDLTPLDFFVWGHLKQVVYVTIPTTPQDMQERIRNACRNITADTLFRCRRSFCQRLQKCIAARGHHFEHLLR